MTKKLACVLSLALAWLPLTAHALGLGEIKLNSSLNDKLNADIQVVGATSDELDSLAVQLASLKQFAQAGLDHPEVLNQLQFVVVRNPDGTAYVHITSNQAVREPFLDFLVDANWNNGELIREYTVLLNPPSFQNANAPAPQPAAAPAAVPTPAPVVAAVPVPVPAPAPVTAAAAAPTPAVATAAPPPVAAPTESAQAAPQPQAVVEAAPPPTTSPPAASAVSSAPAPVQRALGTNYGPIHRGETLSRIAKQLRPEGVSLNQVMLAIYQQNPEVFMHNINRMKAGYILRLPNMSDMQAISVADANAEVRTQMDAWRASRGQAPASTTTAVAENNPPPLQIVAPSSAAESNAQVPGAEKTGNGVAAGAPPAVPPSTQTQTAPPPVTTPSQAPLAVNNNTLSSVQQQANQQTPGPVLPAPSTAPKISPPLVKKPQTGAESGGFLDAILNIYVLIAVVAVGLIVLFGVMLQKRRKNKSGGAFGGAAPRIKGADWLKQEQVGGDDVTQAASSTTRTKAKQAKQAKQDDKTQFMEPATQVAATADDGDKTQLMTSTSHIDTMVANAGGGGSAKLDVSDPLAEADFHMAYGLYDQAADVLRKVLRNDPNRREVAVKLLEVFFTAGDRNSFVAEAKKLRDAMGATPSKEWESVAIMGRQVAPDEPLFSASGSSGTSAAVDIALEGGGTDTVVSDMDALAGAFAGVELGQAAAPAPAPAPAAASDALEFSLPDLEPAPAAAPAPAPAPAPAAGGVEFDLGDLNFEPTPSVKKAEEKKPVVADEPTMASDFGTDSQVEFDKALNDLATFVNTNVPAQPEAAAAEPSVDNLSLSAEAPAAAAPEEDTSGGGSSLSEVGTKLDLARAYIDMGDPEGAKSILQEVVAEGDAQQKKDAQELLKHVS
jgi:pilus assembly protein FimV